MPIFKYQARDSSGKSVSGQMSATNQKALATKLTERRLTLVSASGVGGGGLANMFKVKPKVTTRELGIWSRQFSVMVDAGLPVLQSLNILADAEVNKGFKTAIISVRDDISSGATLSDALSRQSSIWDGLFCNMVKSGEAAGALQEVLNRLAGYIEKKDALQTKVKSAMMYPIVVMVVAVTVVIFLMVKVIPTFKDVFGQFGAELPTPTKIVIMLSEFFQNQWYIALGGAITIFIAVKMFGKTPYGAKKLDQALLKVPVFGDLVRKYSVARFARTLSTLQRSGVAIVEALETTAKTAGNIVIEDAIMYTVEEIRKGQGLADPLRETKVFPSMVVSMMAVGEETGNLEIMLEKIADFYESEVDTAVDGLTSIIEPILIVFLGLVLGFIIVAMFMPMFMMGSLV